MLWPVTKGLIKNNYCCLHAGTVYSYSSMDKLMHNILMNIYYMCRKRFSLCDFISDQNIVTHSKMCQEVFVHVWRLHRNLSTDRACTLVAINSLHYTWTASAIIEGPHPTVHICATNKSNLKISWLYNLFNSLFYFSHILDICKSFTITPGVAKYRLIINYYCPFCQMRHELQTSHYTFCMLPNSAASLHNSFEASIFNLTLSNL